MQNYPIAVDLSEYFTDARRCSLVLIDTTWENVKDLQDHIQKLFHLRNISLLTADGCYLPPKESIKVLQSAESLKAFTLNLEEAAGREGTVSALSDTCKKRKNRSAETEIEFASSTPNNPKRSKSKNSILLPQTFEESLRNGNDKKKKDKRSKRETKRASHTQTELEDVKEASTLTKSASSSRNCTLSQSKSVDARNCQSSKGQENQLLVPDTMRHNRSCNRNEIQGEEVVVGAQPAEATVTETCFPSAKIVKEIEFRCPLMELNPKVVRIFKLPHKVETIEILEHIVLPVVNVAIAKQSAVPEEIESPEGELEQTTEAELEQTMEAELEQTTEAALEQTTEAELEQTTETELEQTTEAELEQTTGPASSPPASQEDSEVKQETLVLEEEFLAEVPSKIAEESVLCSDSDSKDDVIELDDTNVDDYDSDVQHVRPKSNSTSDIIADMLQNAAPLSNVPNVGETLLFKLSKSKDVTTDYIAGTCTYINRRTKALTITIIACASDFTPIVEKYAKNLDESDDKELVLNIDFKLLIEPMVIVSTLD